MPIELDHTIVSSHHRVASAKRLAELLGVPWDEEGQGPFSPVYVNVRRDDLGHLRSHRGWVR